MAVICFWWGGWPVGPGEAQPSFELGFRYLNTLWASVARNTTLSYDFLAFVDPLSAAGVMGGVKVKPLPEQFADFTWNLKKISMFSETAGLQNYDWVVCLDLDLVVTGSLDFLLSHRSDRLVTCKGAYRDDIGGSVVGFCPGMPWAYGLSHLLLDNRESITKAVPDGSERKYYRYCVNTRIMPEPEYWQDSYPGKILSYKVDGYRHGASVVRFHGRPRPHEVKAGWLDKHWREC